MTWPFENNTNAVMKRIAYADLKAHKLKTYLTGIIIAAACCLMAVISSVLLNDALSQAENTPYDVLYRAADENARNGLLNDSAFEKTGIYKNIGATVSDDGQTLLAYGDETAVTFLGYRLVDGAYPLKEADAMVSTGYLELHSLSIGDTFSYSYTDALTHQEQEHTFTVCGIVKNAKAEAAKQFSIFVSDAFRAKSAKEMEGMAISPFTSQTPASIDILARLNPAKKSLDIHSKKEFLKDKGASLGILDYNVLLNMAYMQGFTIDPAVAFGIILFILFLMFASSVVIYSIFYISIISSISMYAQMLSLGTTQKQLSCFLRIQGNLLAIRFLPMGMALSLGISFLCSGAKWLAYDALICLCSGLIMYAVIKLALKKPAKILSALTPTEAIRYNGGVRSLKICMIHPLSPKTLAKRNLTINSKKNRMAITSLSISGALMIALAILITSINLPAMLLQSYPLKEDFQVGIQMDNFYERLPQIIQNNPLSDTLAEEIKSIPGVEKIVREDRLLGTLKKPLIHYEDTDGALEIIESLSPELSANANKVVSGSADPSHMGTDGILLNQFRIANSELNYDEIQTGDALVFQFDTPDGPLEKTFQVKGIVDFSATGLFYTTPEIIQSISPYNNTTHLSIFCKKVSGTACREALQSIVCQNPELTLTIRQEEYETLHNFIAVTTGNLYGIFAFVILFGLLNMVNMLEIDNNMFVNHLKCDKVTVLHATFD